MIRPVSGKSKLSIGFAIPFFIVAALRAQPGPNSGKVVPKGTSKQLDVARDLRRQGKPKESAEVLKKVVQVNPESYLAQYNLGIALGESGDNAGAISAFDRALVLKDRQRIADPTIFNSAGWANLLAGDYKRAEALFKMGEAHAEKLSGESKKRLFNNLGLLYVYMGEPEKAKPYLKKAQEMGSVLATQNLQTIDGMRSKEKH